MHARVVFFKEYMTKLSPASCLLPSYPFSTRKLDDLLKSPPYTCPYLPKKISSTLTPIRTGFTWLYQFPGTVVTNYYKLDGLPQKFLLSQFWKAEVPNRGVSRARLSLKALREDPPLPLPASGGSVFLGFWLHCSELGLSSHSPSSSPCVSFTDRHHCI